MTTHSRNGNSVTEPQRRHVLVRAVLLLTFFSAQSICISAQAVNPLIELNPANPTSNDSVTFKLSGVWVNGCIPQSPKVFVSAGAITIETSNPNAICTQALTPWTLSGTIGELAPGDYSLVATYAGPSVASTVEIIHKSFSVAPSSLSNEVIFPIVANGLFSDILHYQTIFTILNTTTQTVQTHLQVYSNAGQPGGVFCAPLAPPPSSATAILTPGTHYLQYTSADLPFLDGWARLSWDGPASLLAGEEVTMVAAPPAPCLLICNRPSMEKIASAQQTAVRPERAFRLPVTFSRYRQTALALINPSATDTIDVNVAILDEAGNQAKLRVPVNFGVRIGPLQRISKFIWQWALEHSALTVIVPVPESFQGSLVLTSDSLFAVGALNIMFPEFKFVSVPVLGAAR